MPDPVDHARLRELFVACCDLTRDEQLRFADAECDGDAELRAALLRLLEHDEPDDEAFEVGTGDGALPERIGPYRVLARIGEGGMGQVFEAEQEHPRRRIAVKLLRLGMASPEMRQRFANEAELLGSLQHPGIAQVIEFGSTTLFGEELPYLAMELIQGRPLVAYADEHRLDLHARIELFVKVCDAVEHAHRNGIIHRDLKPANILVAGGQPKVLDFGISRLADPDAAGASLLMTMTGQFAGTLGYVSPEQMTVGSARLDLRSDVYSLGVVLYELASGRLPLDVDGQPLATALRTLEEQDPRPLSRVDPTLGGDLETIAGKCLEKDPARRYHSAGELADDLRRMLANEPVLARPVTAFYQLRKFARRHRAAVTGAAAVLVALVVGLVSTLIYAARATAERERALLQAYRASVAAAIGTLDSEPDGAAEYLDDAPEPLRGWEWTLIDARLERGLDWHGDAWVSSDPSSDAVLAVIVDGSELRLFDPYDGAERARIATGVPDPSRPRLAANTDRVAFASASPPAVHVVDLEGHPVGAFPIGEGEQFELGPEGRLLATWAQKQITIRDLDTGEVVMRTDFGSTWVNFEPRTRRLWVVSKDRVGRIQIHDLDTQEVLATINSLRSHARLSFSADGSKIAVGSLRACRLLDAATLDVGAPFTGHRSWIIATCFDRAGRRLASSEESLDGGTTRVFDIGGDEETMAFPGGGMESLAFDDARDVLFGASRRGIRRFALRRSAGRALRGHANYVYLAGFSPDGSLIVSNGWDGCLRLWDAITCEAVAVIPTGMGRVPTGAAFSRDGGTVLATTSDQDECRGWDIATGELVAEHPREAYFRLAADGAVAIQRHHYSGLAHTTFAGGTRIASGNDGVTIQATDTGEELRRFEAPARIMSVAVDREARLLAAGDVDGRITVRALRTGELLGAMQGQVGSVYSLAFDREGRRLFAGTIHNGIDVWDLATFRRIVDLEGHTGYVHCVSMSPDGTRLVSASGDGTLRLWDTVPATQRFEQAQRARALRARVRPWVASLADELGPSAAAARIRASELGDDERRAALRVLLELAQQD